MVELLLILRASSLVRRVYVFCYYFVGWYVPNFITSSKEPLPLNHTEENKNLGVIDMYAKRVLNCLVLNGVISDSLVSCCPTAFPSVR